MEDYNNLPRRERERIRKRREIIESAQKVFAEKGFERATLEEIAREAEFGKGTLYSYFKNKEDLFLSAYTSGLEDLYCYVCESIRGIHSTEQKIKRIIRSSFEYFENNRPFFQMLILEYSKLDMELCSQFKDSMGEKHIKIFQLVSDVLREGIERGELKKMKPSKMASALQSLIHSFIHQNILNPDEYSIQDNIMDISHIFLHGILVDSKNNGGNCERN
ncbi:MAG: TetR/AcrR family transcriptional regulator [Fidelibacterota bacterium]